MGCIFAYQSIKIGTLTEIAVDTDKCIPQGMHACAYQMMLANDMLTFFFIKILLLCLFAIY